MDLNQKLFEKMNNHLLEDNEPSKYFNNIDEPIFFSQYPFTMLNNLKDTKQSPTYHPEGSVWNHTMLVTDNAAQKKMQSSDTRVFMWAALLHDVGKTDTTKVLKGKITSYGHDKVGANQAKEFLQQFTNENDFIIKVTALVRWHMQILFVVNSLPFADIEKMKEHVVLDDIALLGLCDRLGRIGADRKKEEENIRIFLKKCKIEKGEYK